MTLASAPSTSTLMKSNSRQAEPGRDGVESVDLHLFEAIRLHAVVREIAQRVVSGMDALGEAEAGDARCRPERQRNDGHVGQPVGFDVALQVDPLARARLDGNHASRRTQSAGGEQGEISVVGADIEEHHAGLEHLVEEGELVGLERAADIEAEAVIVAQSHVDDRLVVPGQGQRNDDVARRGLFPQRSRDGKPASVAGRNIPQRSASRA